jgi:hypothetical protein
MGQFEVRVSPTANRVRRGTGRGHAIYTRPNTCDSGPLAVKGPGLECSACACACGCALVFGWHARHDTAGSAHLPSAGAWRGGRDSQPQSISRLVAVAVAVAVPADGPRSVSCEDQSQTAAAQAPLPLP